MTKAFIPSESGKWSNKQERKSLLGGSLSGQRMRPDLQVSIYILLVSEDDIGWYRGKNQRTNKTEESISNFIAINTTSNGTMPVSRLSLIYLLATKAIPGHSVAQLKNFTKLQQNKMTENKNALL